MRPNRDPDFFFPDTWRFSVPVLWEWVERNALHIAMADYAIGHDVWMPVQDEEATISPETLAAIRRNAGKAADAQTRAAADNFATLYWRDKGA